MTAISTIRSGTLLTHDIEIKRSRFIATIARTDSPQDAQALIDAVKSEHPQARHNCSAYLIQVDGRNPHQHSSDDGEPSGTAGTPMLEALRAAGVWNVTAVVTRYFGGILLGAGGLVRAYSTAVSEALALAPRAELRAMTVLEAHLSPTDAGRIEADLRHCGAQVLDTQWGADVALRIGTDASEVAFLQERLAQLTGGVAEFQMAGATVVEVDIPSPQA
ncbi:YigZ family protein [Schaalia sp. Marseille-Q2122]|uniref:YigZ family protein n=1 Tax=Schaalia sp. Marseille-Q2122 TaxID=2736604 RepID=UPI00158E931C|nr:YigZ family protein [Schaalia sp. Marseille-Q2122]